MPSDVQVHRLAAFTDDPGGGNPAGVVLTDEPLTDDRMHRIAAEVGYSETAFLTRRGDGDRDVAVRYFAPSAEVAFCGHATIAAAVWLAARFGTGTFTFATVVGPVPVTVETDHGVLRATLTSVPPRVDPAPPHLTDSVLRACALGPDRLDTRYPPAVAFAGARHLVLVVGDRADLARLTYDFDQLRATMVDHDLTTVAVLWPDPDGSWHARNLFPVGGVVEDPATGAAAAAFGAYLRAHTLIEPPASFQVLQGEDMGRPSLLQVSVPAGAEGIRVAGGAVPIPAA